MPRDDWYTSTPEAAATWERWHTEPVDDDRPTLAEIIADEADRD